MPISGPTGQAGGEFLAATYFLDFDTPAVAQFADRACTGIGAARQRAVALYHAVRDSIRYDAYRIDFSREGFRASRALEDGYGFCISKAALLCASARHFGIPARMGFGTFSDIPFDLIHSVWADQMKQTSGTLDARLEGDFGDDGARERAGMEPT